MVCKAKVHSPNHAYVDVLRFTSWQRQGSNWELAGLQLTFSATPYTINSDGFGPSFSPLCYQLVPFTINAYWQKYSNVYLVLLDFYDIEPSLCFSIFFS